MLIYGHHAHHSNSPSLSYKFFLMALTKIRFRISWDQLTLLLACGAILAAALFYATLFFFPAQDGGGHLLNAYALLGSLQNRHPFASTFWVAYDPAFLISNCLSTWVIMLGGAWGHYEAGYRLLVLITLLTIAGGFAFLYRSVNRKWGDGLVIGVIVIIFMHELFLGFFNWICGLGIGFICIGLWVRVRHHSGWKGPVALTLLWLVTFWVHALACSSLLAAFCVIAGCSIIFDRNGMSPLRLILRWYLPLIPAILACAYYASLIPSSGSKGLNFIFIFENFRYVEVIRPFFDKALITGRALGLLFIIGIVEALLDRHSKDRLPGIRDMVLIASVIFIFGFVFLPFARFLSAYSSEGLVNAGRIGGYLNTRMLAPAILLMSVWYGSRKTVWSRAILLIIVGLSLFHARTIAAECLKVQDSFKEIAAAGSHIPPQSVVAHTSQSPELSANQEGYYTHPFQHITSLAVVRSEDSIYTGRFGSNVDYLFPHPFLKLPVKPAANVVLVWKNSRLAESNHPIIYQSGHVTLYEIPKTSD